MRITEAAGELGISPRMLRYREVLGLVPTGRGNSATHRTFEERDLDTIRLVFETEQRFGIGPAELAFGIRVLADPTAMAAMRELGEQLGLLSPPPTQAELDRQRALEWLGRSGMAPAPRPDLASQPKHRSKM